MFGFTRRLHHKVVYAAWRVHRAIVSFGQCIYRICFEYDHSMQLLSILLRHGHVNALNALDLTPTVILYASLPCLCKPFTTGKRVPLSSFLFHRKIHGSHTVQYILDRHLVGFWEKLSRIASWKIYAHECVIRALCRYLSNKVPPKKWSLRSGLVSVSVREKVIL